MFYGERYFLKKTIYPVLVLFVLVYVGCFFGCKSNVEDNIIETEYWQTEEYDGPANTVVIGLSKDVDFFVWTKENGEFISLPIPRGKKFPDTLKFSRGVKTFTFKEPGTYILTIHQKPNNVDFVGKVKVGEKAVRLTDIGYAKTSPMRGIFSISNDSKCGKYGKSSGNDINELTYVMFKKRYWDRKRKKNICVYETQCKYSGLNLKPGKSISLLFPMNNLNEARLGGYILKPIIKDGKLMYFGQTTNRSNRESVQGIMSGDYQGILTPIGNGVFEQEW